MELFSDASYDSSEEEEEEEEEIYCQRELDYWELESLLDSRGPPPIVGYLKKIGVVALRGCIIGKLRTDIDRVVDPSSALCWKSFWSGDTYEDTSHFSYEDWDAIGEFCMQMCDCCVFEPTIEHVRSCMIYVLQLGKFVCPPPRCIVPTMFYDVSR